jgi:UDP-N-acetylmuramyl pentapeptide phosphotransferase/UDP-N-acetylglucosamine-1-phosphate transferase
LLFPQAFSLGGVIAWFGLVLDGIAFVLFVIFVLVSSVILLMRQNAVPAPRVESSRQLHRSYEKKGKRQKPAGHAVGLLTDSPTRPCRTPEMLRAA